jgi:asparagine synthase (glutamine-hydrolysing)
VELSARMPTWLKLDRGRDKIVLRDVVGRWLGSDVADRRKKGFDVPVNDWFRGPLKAMAGDLLASRDSLSSQWIDPVAVRHLIARHHSGRSANGHILWALLSLELWARSDAGGSMSNLPPEQDALLELTNADPTGNAAVCEGATA